MGKKSRYQPVIAKLVGESDEWWCYSILDSRSGRILRINFLGMYEGQPDPGWATTTDYIKGLRSGEKQYHDYLWEKEYVVRADA